jgi:hypothetical protein
MTKVYHRLIDYKLRPYEKLQTSALIILAALTVEIVNLNSETSRHIRQSWI